MQSSVLGKMDWFTWGDLVSIVGVALVSVRLYDRAVKEAVTNENRFTKIEANVDQGKEADIRQDAYLKELRETHREILETLSEMKADIRILKNGK